MAVYNAYTAFFNTIASTSSFETIRKIQKLNLPDLESTLRNAKISDLGTPVIDYVELSFTIKNTALTDKNGTRYIRQGVKDVDVKQVALEYYQKLHLNNVELSVNLVNNISRTSINGMDGTLRNFIIKVII